MLFAANVMFATGVTASLMSLGAIDFGMIVDSSVIMVENCVRRLSHEGGTRPKLDIVRDAAVEVRKPTMFGELIIAIVYLPILALQGTEGKLFRPMALTVIFALFGSMVLSLTLMPVLVSMGLELEDQGERGLARPDAQTRLHPGARRRDPPSRARHAAGPGVGGGQPRRNPLDVAMRAELMSNALARAGKRHDIVPVNDLAESDRWVEHVVAATLRAGIFLSPENTRVLTSNREVDALFARAGFKVVSHEVVGPTPQELIGAIVESRDWQRDAAPEMTALYERYGIVERLRAIFGELLVDDDGELGHARDFASYGAQMDAALVQKLDDLLPHVVPGLVVDKGCGTGKLLVELALRFPRSKFVGVDLSREFLRLCDENHYAAEDVAFVAGNVADRQVQPGTATTIVFSSVVHEIYSYNGYDRNEVHRALGNAAAELAPSGRILVRDGVSWGPEPCRMRFLNDATRTQWARFAIEFKHGEGAAHERIADDEVRLSRHLANEFLCKKDYLKNWHIEVHEEYGTFTPDEWRAALSRAGLHARTVHAYANPWIVEHRYRGTVELCDDDGRELPWPPTNIVVVGDKRA